MGSIPKQNLGVGCGSDAAMAQENLLDKVLSQ